MESYWKQRNKELIKKMFLSGALKSAEVAKAFSLVERHRYIPKASKENIEAYEDIAIFLPVSKENEARLKSSSSMPSVTARTLEAAGIQRGYRVLEIGTGSGYQAALLSHLVGSEGGVVSLDIDERLTGNAQEALRGCGISNVRVELGNGWQGSPGGGGFDRIIVTAATPELSPSWMTQLNEGGEIIVPLVYSNKNALTSMLRLHRSGAGLAAHLVPGLEVVGFVPLLRGEGDAAFSQDPGLNQVQQKTLSWFQQRRRLQSPGRKLLAFLMLETHAQEQELAGAASSPEGLQALFTRMRERWESEQELGTTISGELIPATGKGPLAGRWCFRKQFFHITMDWKAE